MQEPEAEIGITAVTIADIKSIKPDTLGNCSAIMGFLTLAAAQCGDGQVRVVDSLRLQQIREGETHRGQRTPRRGLAVTALAISP